MTVLFIICGILMIAAAIYFNVFHKAPFSLPANEPNYPAPAPTPAPAPIPTRTPKPAPEVLPEDQVKPRPYPR